MNMVLIFLMLIFFITIGLVILYIILEEVIRLNNITNNYKQIKDNKK